MENKLSNWEYYLGYNPDWEEYEIVEHNTGRPVGLGSFCFRISDDRISDGDGFPTYYDDTYVKIEEKDFHHVKDLFYKTGEEMCALAEKYGKPIARPIAPGDYVYDGGEFMYIQNISDDREKLWIESFYYDTYDLNLDTDLDEVGKEEEYDVKEIESDGLLITEDVYRQALNIAKAAILEITGYLSALYKVSKANRKLTSNKANENENEESCHPTRQDDVQDGY